MTHSQICERISRDLDYLAVEFIYSGQLGAAYRMLEMASSLSGKSLFDDDKSPMDLARDMTAAGEGGAT